MYASRVFRFPCGCPLSPRSKKRPDANFFDATSRRKFGTLRAKVVTVDANLEPNPIRDFGGKRKTGKAILGGKTRGRVRRSTSQSHNAFRTAQLLKYIVICRFLNFMSIIPLSNINIVRALDILIQSTCGPWGRGAAVLLLLGIVLVPLAALGRHPRVVERLRGHRALRQDLDEVAVRVLLGLGLG